MAKGPEPRRWLLLIHQIPPRPNYLRVKVGRQLQKMGAVALKNSVYVLPLSEGSRESFEWIGQEIRSAGGDATVCESHLVGGLTDEGVERMFNAARSGDYKSLLDEVRGVRKRIGKKGRFDAALKQEVAAGVARVQKRLAEIETLDHFGAPGRDAVRAGLGELESMLREEAPRPVPARGSHPKAAVWVTRKGIHVDRMASAWLIRRFIDAEARFKFVPAKGYVPEEGELRFDMFEAEFTHEGDLCTFEVLLRHFGLETDSALGAVAEIVHAIDLRDGRDDRPERPGVERVVTGIAAGKTDDEARLAASAVLFDALYEGFQKGRRT